MRTERRGGVILIEGVLRAQALRRAVGDDGTGIDPVRQLPQAAPSGDATFEPLGIARAQLADGEEAQLAQQAFGLLAHSPESTDGQRRQKGAHRGVRDHALAVRLRHVRGDLGHEFHGRDPGRRRQLQLVRDADAQARGDGGGVSEQGTRGGDIEEGLVERQWLDQGRDAPEDGQQQFARLRIGLEAWAHHDRGGCPAHRLDHRHRAAHPEPAHLVGGGQDHPAPGISAHDHRQAPQLGMIALLDRRIEGVHVEVNDRAFGRGVGHGRGASQQRQERCRARG
jgi:hypothetical protein